MEIHSHRRLPNGQRAVLSPGSKIQMNHQGGAAARPGSGHATAASVNNIGLLCLRAEAAC